MLLHRLFRVELGEWPKLLQFGMFGFLLQMGMGIGFSAGDAAFLSNVGADKLPIIFLMTPVVMLVYTGIFSFLMVRFSIDHMVDFTLGMLIAGGATLWALLNYELDPAWQTALYYALKLYLAMWYIALYTLFWNYTDTYFDIQDAKRLFPLFAAFCALGTATGALIVSAFASVIPMHYFMLIWSGVAFLTAPLARLLRRRWKQIAESELDLPEESSNGQLAAIARAFAKSRYTWVLTLTLFVTLLLTNLAEYQYSTVLEKGRSEADLAALFGQLYAACNIFNLFVCLLVFNRLVSRFGVRNVALILPLSYFVAFCYFFVQGGTGAAIAAFFVYHGVLTSIEYNNQNLLFNAVPSSVKRQLRTVVEGMCEPLASLVAGAFLLLAAAAMDMRELSGIGVIIGLVLIAIVVALRQLYPAAMTLNMRQGWLNFGDRSVSSPHLESGAIALLRAEAANERSPAAAIARTLLRSDKQDDGQREDVDDLLVRFGSQDPAIRAEAIAGLTLAATPEDIHLVPLLAGRLAELTRAERRSVIQLLGRISDSETIPEIIGAASELGPRDRRAIAAMLAGIGETAVPRLASTLRDTGQPYRIRSIAARALAEVSYAQFASQLASLVRQELRETGPLLAGARRFEAAAQESTALALLARAQRERVNASVDFTLELLALAGQLPNFDLLIVSLHSANAKVRGNAIETIETGVDNATFRLLEPLLRQRESVSANESQGELLPLLDQALTSGQGVETLAAAQALHERLDADEFARRVRRLTSPDMPDVLRDELLGLLEIGSANGSLPVLDIIAKLCERPGIGGAALDTLLVVAQYAQPFAPAGPAIQDTAKGIPFWIHHRDLRNVAGRYPDLALVMLKMLDDRPYAA
jgi:AAA family ATP:ADP antiporter